MSAKITAERLRQLAQLSPFAGLDEADLVLVDQLVDDIELDPGDVLIREGANGSQALVILSGQAGVTIAGRRVATLSAGDIVGRRALLEGGPRTATVTAETPVRVLVLDPRSFTAARNESTARSILSAIVGRLRAAGPEDASHSC